MGDILIDVTRSDNNALARLKNSRVANPEHTLTPLKEAATNLPIKNFPKHEKDIRIMSRKPGLLPSNPVFPPLVSHASAQSLRELSLTLYLNE